jgi:prepilin-type N-terminal cleavage/methylation domain-containing protein
MLRNQKGFTLIEIIAVLVILGILAAIAIPKYLDLQETSKLKSIDGALAAGGSNAYMQYSKALLLTSTAPTTADLVTSLEVSTYKRVGDFTVAYTAGAAPAGCTKAITVTYTLGPPDGTSATYYTDSTPAKTFCVE